MFGAHPNRVLPFRTNTSEEIRTDCCLSQTVLGNNGTEKAPDPLFEIAIGEAA
jgi:hypothetical protein